MRDIKFILTNSGRDSVDLSYNFSSRFSNAVFSYDNEWPTIKAANGRFSVKMMKLI